VCRKVALCEEMCYIAELSVGIGRCSVLYILCTLYTVRFVVTLILEVSSLTTILTFGSITYDRFGSW
jgi:hypothetical protein